MAPAPRSAAATYSGADRRTSPAEPRGRFHAVNPAPRWGRRDPSVGAQDAEGGREGRCGAAPPSGKQGLLMRRAPVADAPVPGTPHTPRPPSPRRRTSCGRSRGFNRPGRSRRHRIRPSGGSPGGWSRGVQPAPRWPKEGPSVGAQGAEEREGAARRLPRDDWSLEDGSTGWRNVWTCAPPRGHGNMRRPTGGALKPRRT
jgi:hypothetical protein